MFHGCLQPLLSGFAERKHQKDLQLCLPPFSLSIDGSELSLLYYFRKGPQSLPSAIFMLGVSGIRQINKCKSVSGTPVIRVRLDTGCDHTSQPKTYFYRSAFQKAQKMSKHSKLDYEHSIFNQLLFKITNILTCI